MRSDRELKMFRAWSQIQLQCTKRSHANTLWIRHLYSDGTFVTQSWVITDPVTHVPSFFSCKHSMDPSFIFWENLPDSDVSDYKSNYTLPTIFPCAVMHTPIFYMYVLMRETFMVQDVYHIWSYIFSLLYILCLFLLLVVMSPPAKSKNDRIHKQQCRTKLEIVQTIHKYSHGQLYPFKHHKGTTFHGYTDHLIKRSHHAN